MSAATLDGWMAARMGLAAPLTRAAVDAWRLARLNETIAYARAASPFYRARRDWPDGPLARIEDLARLPFTTPEEVAASFPYGLFAFPLREVIRLHSTLGPEGKPLVIGHTRNDLAQWGRLVARQLAASGVTANDVVLISLGGAVHPGASGYVLGAELIEAKLKA